MHVGESPLRYARHFVHESSGTLLALYTTQGMVYTLGVHDDAKADLAEIAKTVPKAAASITALLEVIKASQWWLESLSMEEFGASESQLIHVDAIEHESAAGRNIWRFKAWNLEKQNLQYRVIYSFDTQKRHYLILAVVPRTYAYNPAHPRINQLQRLYDSLGIRRLGS